MSKLPYILFALLVPINLFGAAIEETVAEIDSPKSDDVTEPPSIHVLLKKNRNSMFRMSPDGSKVAFMQWAPSGYYMVVHKTSDGEPIQVVPFGRLPPSELRWLTPRRLLYSQYEQISAIDFDGTNGVKLLRKFDSDRSKNYKKSFRAWRIEHLLPGDPEHILAQSWNADGHPAIVKVNIYTGEERELVFEPRLDIDGWAIDQDGDVRFGTRYKKDELQFLALDEQSRKWTVYDDYSLDGANTLGHTGKTYLSRRVNLESFDYDDDHIYMATNQNSDRFKIVKYNIADRRVVEDVYASDKYDIGGLADHTYLLFDDASKSVVGLEVEEERRRTVWFDQRFQAYQELIDRHRPEHRNQIVDWSDDLKTLLVYSSSDVDPGRHSIVLTESGKLFTFAINNDELESEGLSRTKLIEYQARDGYVIHGYMNPDASGVADKKLIVLPHGGPWARDNWYFDAWVQYFATRGYNVLRVNFRGSTGYGREHLLSGIKNIDTLMIDDIADGARWAIEQGYADPGSVYIFGHSYGGYAAIMSTVKYPELYSAAVAWSAPLDLLAQLKKYKKDDAYFAYEFWKTAVGDPRKEKQVLKRLSPLYNIDALSAPLMVFHGERDNIIPEEQAIEFKKALRKAGNPTEVHVIDNERHTFSNNSNITYVLEKTLRFFAQHVTAP